MKEKIKEIQDYFADKLARGLYKVVKVDEHHIEVMVDRKHIFRLWISSHWEFFEVWSESFMKIVFTEQQKKRGYKTAKRHQKRLYENEARAKEIAKLKELAEKYPEELIFK